MVKHIWVNKKIHRKTSVDYIFQRFRLVLIFSELTDEV